ncbi:UNVERIFIED_CONTAM: hypothetical protein RMT77_003805 [Armadillidium vulgare]
MGLFNIYCTLAIFILFTNSLNAYEIRRPAFYDKFKNLENAPGSIYDLEDMTVPEIIQSFGYPAEVHHVTTEDGYILELHRIPYGVDGPSEEVRPVAFLQHGLLSSSSDWIADRPGRALAYIMADAGYDVWLNNVRGNVFSKNHTTLDPHVDKEEFWAFTYDEMGTYDVPAAIDYALNVTGQDQIYYVGFSMGTTVFFIMMSERPEYLDKIRASTLMAPVVYMNNIKGLLRPLANISGEVDTLLSELGLYQVTIPQGRSNDLVNKFCSEGNITAPACYSLVYLVCGFDPVELNKELYPVILAHEPGGTSFHTVNHYAQQILSDVFQKYDLGAEENLKRYGEETPPAFNLQEAMPPLAFISGDNDFLANPEDVARVAGEIQNLQLNHRVEYKRWNHIDFCWGIHAKEYVYDYVVEFFSAYLP